MSLTAVDWGQGIETYNIYRESDMEFKDTALIDVCAVNAITIYYISYY